MHLKGIFTFKIVNLVQLSVQIIIFAPCKKKLLYWILVLNILN